MPMQFAQGQDNEAGLAVINPQPFCAGAIPSKRIITPGGAVYEDGQLYAELVYSSIPPSTYGSLLTFFGLASVLYADCTITLPNDTFSGFVTYNGVIVKPQKERDSRLRSAAGFLQNVLFLVRELEVVT